MIKTHLKLCALCIIYLL